MRPSFFAVALATSICLAPLSLAQPGYITTIAGTGTVGDAGDGGPGAAAQLNNPQGVAVDAMGNVYIADYFNSRIRKLLTTDFMQTIAGCGGFMQGCTDLSEGRLAGQTAIFSPWDVALDPLGNFYFPDSGQNKIRKIGADGILRNFAGSGPGGVQNRGFAGDGGPATSAKLNNPIGMTFDHLGNLYFADHDNQRIRKVDTNGVITTIAGNGTMGFSGDGGLAIHAQLHAPHGVAVDLEGNVYIADTTNYRIRKITPDGIIQTIAGTGQVTASFLNNLGDGGPAIHATFVPWDVEVDAQGNLYIADWTGHRIRKIDAASGIITTLAGTGEPGFSGDGGPGVNAQVNMPAGLTVDPMGNVYFADSGNHRVRRIEAPPPPAPQIRTTNPVIPSFMGAAGFSSNMYLEIYGTNFSRVSRTWTGADFNGSNAPTSLEGASVTVNGNPAFIYYVSPAQININVPEDTATGPVEIVVTTAGGSSNAVTVERSRLSPAMLTTPGFRINGVQYVVAQTPDGSLYIGRPGMIPGVAFVTPKPGDTVTIYALGLGPTNPATQAGIAAAQTSEVLLPLDVEIGDVHATVSFKGMPAGTIGLYQLNIVIPNLPAGDHEIELKIDGVDNDQDLFIVIGE